MLYTLNMENKQSFGVVVERKYYVEGDERSRTNPGHGYPAHTDTFQEFKEFSDRESLETWLLNNHDSYKIIKVLSCYDLEFKVVATVKIENKYEN